MNCCCPSPPPTAAFAPSWKQLCRSRLLLPAPHPILLHPWLWVTVIRHSSVVLLTFGVPIPHACAGDEAGTPGGNSVEDVSSSGTACSHSRWSFLMQLVFLFSANTADLCVSPGIPDCSRAGCLPGEQGFLSMHSNSPTRCSRIPSFCWAVATEQQWGAGSGHSSATVANLLFAGQLDACLFCVRFLQPEQAELCCALCSARQHGHARAGVVLTVATALLC